MLRTRPSDETSKRLTSRRSLIWIKSCSTCAAKLPTNALVNGWFFAVGTGTPAAKPWFSPNSEGGYLIAESRYGVLGNAQDTRSLMFGHDFLYCRGRHMHDRGSSDLHDQLHSGMHRELGWTGGMCNEVLGSGGCKDDQNDHSGCKLEGNRKFHEIPRISKTL
jgi:hypothetical protein